MIKPWDEGDDKKTVKRMVLRIKHKQAALIDLLYTLSPSRLNRPCHRVSTTWFHEASRGTKDQLRTRRIRSRGPPLVFASYISWAAWNKNVVST